MLQRIRNKLKGGFALFLLILIAVPFVLFFGAESFFFPNDPNLIAEVDGEPITSFDVDTEVNNQRQVLGEQADSVDDEWLRMLALRTVVGRTIQRQSLAEAGLRITDLAVARHIADIPEFKGEDGMFSKELYNRMLLGSGRSDPEFRALFNDYLLQSQVQVAYLHGTALPLKQSQGLAALAGERRSLRYIPLQLNVLAQGYAPTAKQQKRHYEANKEEYRNPESRILRYIDLNYRTLANRVPVKAEDARAEYQLLVAEAAREQRMRASAIVLLYGTPERSSEQAKTLAQQLLQRINDGEKFEALVREYSDDSATAEQDGDLGWSDKGGYTESFIAALQDLEPSDTVIVDTSDAQVVLRLEEKDSVTVGTFEEESVRIRSRLRESEGRQIFDEQYERLQDLAFESDSLTEIAGSMGLAIITSDPISQTTNTGLAEIPGVKDIAFELEENEMSRLLDVGDGRVLLAELGAIVPEHELTEEQARPVIIQDMARKFAIDERDKLIEQIRDLLVERELSFTRTAVRLGLSWEPIDNVTRAQLTVPELAQLVFALKKPAPDARVYDSLILPDGNALVLELTEVSTPLVEEVNNVDTHALLEQVRRTYAMAYASLREEMLLSEAEDRIEWFQRSESTDNPSAP